MANVFLGDLRIPVTEEFGPKLNSRTVAILHPDMHQTSQDLGRERVSQRRVDRSTWLPDENLGNLVMKDIHEINSNNEVIAVADPYEYQKVGPGEPLAAVAPRYKPELVHVEANSVYLEDNYAHSDPLTNTAQEEGKVLFKLS